MFLCIRPHRSSFKRPCSKMSFHFLPEGEVRFRLFAWKELSIVGFGQFHARNSTDKSYQNSAGVPAPSILGTFVGIGARLRMWVHKFLLVIVFYIFIIFCMHLMQILISSYSYCGCTDSKAVKKSSFVHPHRHYCGCTAPTCTRKCPSLATIPQKYIYFTIREPICYFYMLHQE